MSDAQYALSPSAAPPPTEADYDSIFAAVMETARGRWFLAEYAKRNRNADSELILAALDRVESVWRQRRDASPTERVRFDLLEMAKAIAQTKAEIAAITPEGEAKGTLLEATEELSSIVRTTEQATSSILAAAEHVQEIAWKLRERGTDNGACDALDQRATDIYSACSFQDLTGQRTRKVVEVMRFLEDRIKAMIDIWGETAPGTPAAATAGHPPRIDDGGAEDHLDQPHIDEIMPAPAAVAPMPPRAETSGNGHDAGGHDLAAPPAAAVPPAGTPDRRDAVAGDAVVHGAAARDAESHDSEAHDAEADAASADAGVHDALAQANGIREAGAEDAGIQDAGIQDAGMQDAAIQDAGAPDTGGPDALPSDAGIHDAGGAVSGHDGGAPDQTPAAAEHAVSPAVAAVAATAMAQQPAPLETSHQPEGEPTPGDLRTDPAALLSRILAIIQVPADQPAAFGEPDAGALPKSEPTAASSPADAVSSLDRAPTGETDIAMVALVTTSVVASAAPAAPVAEAEAEPVPADVGNRAGDTSPLPGPISVAEAVEKMLFQVPNRAAPPARPSELAAEPEWAAEHPGRPADEAPRPFVIDVPELTLAPKPAQTLAPDPVQAARSAPKPALQEVVLPEPEPILPEPKAALAEAAAPKPEARRPEPAAILPEVALRAPEAIRPEPDAARRGPEALAQEASAVLAMPAEPRFVEFRETPAGRAAEPPSRKATPFAAPARTMVPAAHTPPKPAAPPPGGLAAITALSEEEKIALFS